MNRIHNTWWNKKCGFTPEMCNRANAVMKAERDLEHDFANPDKAIALVKAATELLAFIEPQSGSPK